MPIGACCNASPTIRRKIRDASDPNPALTRPNLIPEFERVVAEAQPTWFLMENVPGAPEPVVPGYIVCSLLLNNRWLGEVQNRVRRFSFGTHDGRSLDVEIAALETQDWQPAVMASGGRPTPIALGPNGKRKATTARNIGWKTDAYLQHACELQGLPPGFLADSPLTVRGKIRLVGNGVALPMARAITKAVKKAMGG